MALSKWKGRHYFNLLSMSVVSNSNLIKHLSTAKNTVVDTVYGDSRPGVANVSSANKEGHGASKQQKLDL